MTAEITVVVPVRLSIDNLYDELMRLRNLATTLPRDLFTLLWVDEGTSQPRDSELIILAEELNVRLVRSCGPDQAFSIGRARDCGVRTAQTPLVMIHDLDLIALPETYRSIAAEAQLRRLTSSGYDFITVPAIFLTETGTQAYLQHWKADESLTCSSDRRAHDWAFRGRADMVEHFALSPSVLVINRMSYMGIGGHDQSFYGHGAEDFEFYHRANALAPRADRPPDYEVDHPFQIGAYSGFRSYFALRGVELWMRGVALVHLWHPRRELTVQDYARSKDNFSLLVRRMKEFDATGAAPSPLSEPSAPNTRPIMDPAGADWLALRFIAPFLGAIKPIDPGLYSDSSALSRKLKDEGAERVLIVEGDERAAELTDDLNIPVLSFEMNPHDADWRVLHVNAAPPRLTASGHGEPIEAGPWRGVLALEGIQLEGKAAQSFGSPPPLLLSSAFALQVMGKRQARSDVAACPDNDARPLAALKTWAANAQHYVGAREWLATLVPISILRTLPKIPTMFALWSEVGDWHRDQGAFIAARESYRRAVACDPQSAAYQIQLGHMAKETGDRRLAARSYTAALRLLPNDADLLFQIGHFHMSGGEFRDALDLYGKAVALSPDNADYQLHLEQAAHQIEASPSSV